MSFKAGDKVVCVEKCSSHRFPGEVCEPEPIDVGPAVYCVVAAFSVLDYGEFFPRIDVAGYSRTYNGKNIGWHPKRFRLVHRCEEAAGVENKQEGWQ